MKPSSAKQKGSCRRCKSLYERIDITSRICPKCKTKCSKCNILLTESNRDKSSLDLRIYYVCKACVAATVRNSRDKDKQTEYDLFRKYGISTKDRDIMAESQKYKCAICRIPTKLNVDHCHSTGKVRGLLCGSCNKAIGLLKDDINILKNAIRYLDPSI